MTSKLMQRAAALERRDRKITKLAAQGQSFAAIARSLGLTRQRVQQIVHDRLPRTAAAFGGAAGLDPPA